ncbi:MAG: HEAT repeat domain-containing protein, partial [Verrucomicrobiota bacterium]
MPRFATAPRLWVGLIAILLANALAVPLPGAPTDGAGPLLPDSSTSVLEGAIREELPWYGDLENALGVAKEEYRPVLVFFHSPTDGWSKRMKAQVFADEAVKKHLEFYVRVEIAVEGNEDTAAKYLVRGIPSIRLLSAEGRVLGGRDGFVDTPAMARMLQASLNAEFLRKSDPEFQKLITALEENAVTPDQWPELMSNLGDSRKRDALRGHILKLDPFPRLALVSLLENPHLAVRLGAIEILEEISGDTFGFDPWAGGPGSVENQAAVAKWQSWLDQGSDGAVEAVYGILSEDQIASYIRDIIGDDRDRANRARNMLRNGGDNAAASLRQFLDHNKDLPPPTRNRVRELYYALSLPVVGGSDSDTVASRLINGNLDVRLETLGQLKQVGRSSVPVLGDFLEDPDPLIRETSIDAVLTAGRSLAVDTVVEHLETETDEAVLISALRAIGVNEIRPAADMVAGYAAHESEDIAVMALESLAALRASDQREAIESELSDPRWRVRVAALETVARFKSSSYADAIRPALKDPDPFVRTAAIQTLSVIGNTRHGKDLMEVYEDDPDLRGPVVSGLLKLDIPLPKKLADDLRGAEPDQILSVLDAIGNSRGRDLRLVGEFLAHSDVDVSCAAIRIVGENGMEQRNFQQAFADILESDRAPQINAALESMSFAQRQYQYFASRQGLNTSEESMPPDIQQIYDSFLQSPASPGSSTKVRADPLSAVINATRPYLNDTDESRRHAASLLLTKAGVPEAIEQLKSGLGSKSVSQRKTVAIGLDDASEAAIPVFEALLRDPSSDVRSAAAESVLENGEQEPFLTLFFEEMTRPASRLQPWEAPIYDLRSATRYGTSKTQAKSNGGIMAAELGKTQPIAMLLSGTASGVIGAADVAARIG